jgi:alpha-tubulin suppressor-like RCC1 family protein
MGAKEALVGVETYAPAVAATRVPADAAPPASAPAADHLGAVAWGANHSGQLGDGTRTGRPAPAAVAGLHEGVVAVAGGFFHTAVLRSDGTVLAWGDNRFGQVGDGTTITRDVPVRVAALTVGVEQIAASGFHTLAVAADGSVWCWGNNLDGQLGDGTRTDRVTPERVPGLTKVVQVAGGASHSLALRSDGTVWTWGDNTAGQLGDGTTRIRCEPVRVARLKNVTQIAAGAASSAALRADGTVVTWGGNFLGQLGDGSVTDRAVPARVAGLTGVTRIAANGEHCLAVLAAGPERPAGTVVAWGSNFDGQLGDGSRVDRPRPVPVAVLAHVTRVAAGRFHSLAVRADGTLWTWGAHDQGQLGDPAGSGRVTPGRVPGLTGVTDACGGPQHSVAVHARPAGSRP